MAQIVRLLFLSSLLSTFALAGVPEANRSQPGTLTVSVRQIGTAFIRFEICKEGDCRGFGGGTGIFRISDLEERYANLIINRPENMAYDQTLRKILYAAGPVGMLVILLKIGVFDLAPDLVRSAFAAKFLSGLAGVGSVPFYLWVTYHSAIEPASRKHAKLRAHYLRRAMDENFDEESDYHLGEHLSWLKMALNGIDDISLCEAGLEN